MDWTGNYGEEGSQLVLFYNIDFSRKEKKCFKNTMIPSSFLLGKSAFGQYCSPCQVKAVFEETTTESAFKRRRV